MKFEHPIELAEEIQLNMTPVIDVVFMLIIFFLASAALSVGTGEDVALPVASEARLAERLNPDSITITVQAAPTGATFSVSGRGYTYEELLKKLRVQVEIARLKHESLPPVIIRADYRVEYRPVQQLMFDCAAMGIQVFNFQATPVEEKRP